MGAGSRALRIAAAAQAADHFERALELMAENDPRRPELLLKLGQAFGLAGSERAMPYLEDALRAAEAAGDGPVVVWTHHMLASPAMNQRISLELMAELQAEQEEMLDNPRYQQLAVDLFGSFDGYPRIAFLRANGLLQQGYMNEARALIAELIQRIGDRPLPNELASLQRTVAFYEGRLADWLDLHHHFLVQGARQKRNWQEVDATFSLLSFQLRFQADDPDLVDETARRYLRAEDRVREWVGVGPLPDGYTSLGFYYFLRGDWQRAEHNLIDVCQRHRLQRWPDLWTRYWAAQLLLSRGDLSGARTAYAPVHPLQPGDEADSVGPPVILRCMRAWLHLAAGEMERAREWVEVTQRWLERVPDHPEQAQVWITWAEYYRDTGRPAVARDWADRALAAAGRVNYSLAMVRALRLLGDLAAATGAVGEADAHFHAAQTLAERCRCPYEAALTQLARARALHGAPDAGGLAAARATFARLGAGPALAEADALLARTAAPAAPEPAPAGHNLTDREVEVVRLVAQGLTDKEVAARMFISPKTVDGHLRHIFNKVGVSSRTALAAFAARQGMLG